MNVLSESITSLIGFIFKWKLIMITKNEFSLIFNSSISDKYKNNPFPGGHEISLNMGRLFLSIGTELQTYSLEYRTAYLIGSLYNREFLISIVSMWEAHSHVFNDAELLLTLHERLNQSALILAEGNFSFLIDDSRGYLSFFSEPQGLSSSFLVCSNFNWLTNSLKAVSRAEGEKALQFESETTVCNGEIRPDSYTPIINAQRFKPCSFVTFSQDRENHLQTDIKSLTIDSRRNSLSIQKNTLLEVIDYYLSEPIHALAKRNKIIGIPLSGGLDSSLITALASRYFDEIFTYSIGSEFGDEFEFSQMVSDSVGTNHQIKTLTESDIIDGIVNAIYYNEIFDGLSAEIQSGLFNIYKIAHGQVRSMITGYGSDLLFGGILTPEIKYENPNSLLASQIYRTRWTGEFSSNGASHFGIDVRHPFWNQHLITLCRDLDHNYKIRNNEVKNILREYTEQLDILPDKIVWRKKIGIHEGSSVNRIFADILGTDINNYQVKSRLTYRLYKAMISGKMSVEDVTMPQLIKLME